MHSCNTYVRVQNCNYSKFEAVILCGITTAIHAWRRNINLRTFIVRTLVVVSDVPCITAKLFNVVHKANRTQSLLLQSYPGNSDLQWLVHSYAGYPDRSLYEHVVKIVNCKLCARLLFRMVCIQTLTL